MNQENKYENISNLSLDSFSFEFSSHEQNNLEDKDNNKEEQKEYIFKIFNNNINSHSQELNQKANNEEVHKYKEKKNDAISCSQTYI